MTYEPNAHYRTVLKFGMSGWDVWACQIALNGAGTAPKIVEDGAFGPQTEEMVKRLQSVLGVAQDGVLGPVTQDALCIRESRWAEKGTTPPGLLIGICRGESGAIIPATTGAYENGSRDFGPFQDNLNLPTDAQLHIAFNVRSEAAKTAGILSASHKTLKAVAASWRRSEEELWKLAVLSYNWPAAAVRIAKGERHTWVYTSQGKQYRLDDPAPWVELYKIPGVTTGWDWCQHYINTKVQYVTSWTV